MTKIIEEGFKEINGIKIYYKSIGEGEPLFVLHGGPGLAHNYLFPHFSKLAEDYEVIFFDQRSCGKSSGDEIPHDITMDNLVKDLEELRQSFNIEKINVLGQSFGGLLALNYAIKYPERLKTLLILESTGARSDFIKKFQENINSRVTEDIQKELSETNKKLNELTSSKVIKNGVGKVFSRYLSIINKLYFYNTSYMKNLDMEYFDDEMVRKSFTIQKQLHSYLIHYNLLNQLPRITCPTLIIHGDYDPIPYEEIELIHKTINGSEIFLIKECGHFAHIEKPIEYFHIIRDFLYKNT
ncbi:alpha/beta fold hydrolase [Mycoplasmatota bacterium]|nr:alpha/beta fold hydrolase [Mycoplasmatota bacterium]